MPFLFESSHSIFMLFSKRISNIVGTARVSFVLYSLSATPSGWLRMGFCDGIVPSQPYNVRMEKLAWVKEECHKNFWLMYFTYSTYRVNIQGDSVGTGPFLESRYGGHRVALPSWGIKHCYWANSASSLLRQSPPKKLTIRAESPCSNRNSLCNGVVMWYQSFITRFSWTGKFSDLCVTYCIVAYYNRNNLDCTQTATTHTHTHARKAPTQMHLAPIACRLIKR